MKLTLLAFISIALVAFSCKPQITDNSNYNAEFIAMCIDSTLHLDRGTSTQTYFVDFGKVKVLPDSSIQQFLATHSYAHAANLDSLEHNDTNWLKYGFFQNAVVKFDRIECHADSIIVNTSKIKAADGSNGTEMIFKRRGSSYICLYSGITWIS